MTSRDLGRLIVDPKSGNEQFTDEGVAMDLRLDGFWRWACSDLVGNTMRGMFAEYIVGLALDCVGSGTRAEWDATDLETADGTKIEVKSSAYLQSWPQRRLSKIEFSIRPSFGWDYKTNTYAEERKRNADAYIFCVLTATDKSAVNPMCLDQWDFYVMSTDRLNHHVGAQKTISLSRLRQLEPTPCSFAQLPARVEAELPGTQ